MHRVRDRLDRPDRRARERLPHVRDDRVVRSVPKPRGGLGRQRRVAQTRAGRRHTALVVIDGQSVETDALAARERHSVARNRRRGAIGHQEAHDAAAVANRGEERLLLLRQRRANAGHEAARHRHHRGVRQHAALATAARAPVRDARAVRAGLDVGHLAAGAHRHLLGERPG